MRECHRRRHCRISFKYQLLVVGNAATAAVLRLQSNPTMHCIVREIVGENAITADDGQVVYDQIQAALSVGEIVELDFSGVAVFASPFFNAAISRLLGDHSPDDLARLLRITGLDSPGHDLLRRMIESGKRYYASTDYREAQSRVLSDLVEADFGCLRRLNGNALPGVLPPANTHGVTRPLTKQD